MQLVRYMTNDGPRFGTVTGAEVRQFRDSPFDGPPVESGVTHRLEDLRLMAPTAPSKIVLLSKNYHETIRNLGLEPPDEPLIFLKPPTTVVGPEDAIRIPDGVGEVTCETELAVVIGRACQGVPVERVDECILGYTILNDVSAKEIVKREVQFTRAKGYDTFAPMGPCVVDDVDPDALGIRSSLNGEVVTDSNTSDMIFSAREVVSFVSRCMTLLPGDVVSTGASGAARPVLRAGDRLELEVDGIGTLRNHVVGSP
jgi:2-keto-4-pentenoate hydratase/2-oxohepta-3-ene-1,7-dioic acid hydratase in catechol pathway